MSHDMQTALFSCATTKPPAATSAPSTRSRWFGHGYWFSQIGSPHGAMGHLATANLVVLDIASRSLYLTCLSSHDQFNGGSSSLHHHDSTRETSSTGPGIGTDHFSCMTPESAKELSCTGKYLFVAGSFHVQHGIQPLPLDLPSMPSSI